MDILSIRILDAVVAHPSSFYISKRVSSNPALEMVGLPHNFWGRLAVRENMGGWNVAVLGEPAIANEA